MSGRSISIHRCYSVSEIADAFGVHRGTVLRWIRERKLAPIDHSKPFLINGGEVQDFINRRKPKKQKCALDEWFCFRCKKPQHAAFADAEIISANAKTCNTRALCTECTAIVHKRIAIGSLAQLRQSVSLSAPLHLKHLIE
ncbi:MAG: helix-turn-helix domain-containing protein [Parvularculaceae bacterium]